MSAEINYKKKYLELRGKYINDLDMAFRIGFEQGGQQEQMNQMAQAQQQQAEMEAQAGSMGQEQPGQEGEQPGMEGQPQEGGSELDQHIAELEQLLGSSQDPAIQKSLSALVSMRKAELLRIELKKSEQAINGIAKALHKPIFRIGKLANHNMTDSGKKAVGMQEKIVSDIMKKWEDEGKSTANDIKHILSVEGLTKKE